MTRVLLVCCLAMLACNDARSEQPNLNTSSTSGAATRTATSSSAAGDAPTTAARQFTAEMDHKAALLFADRQKSVQREELATHYARNGYKAMSKLFDESQGATIDHVTWLCRLDNNDAAVRRRVSAVVQSVDAGDYLAAMTTAEQALHDNPNSCELRVEWAVAVIMLALIDPNAPSLDKQERALRTLVTTTAEIGIIPQRYTGRGQVLHVVALYLKASGDSTARRRALLMAHDLLKLDEASTTSPALLRDYRRLRIDIEQQLSTDD